MTLKEPELTKAMQVIRDFRRPEDGAKAAGVNLEGPFVSYEKRGAQNPDNIALPDIGMLERLNEASGGLVRLITLAPELEGAMDFIRQAARICTVSLGHSAADYETAVKAYGAGASHTTHLFNAMPSIHHRKPGVIGAASECENVVAELICDGLHVHPSSVRMAFKLFPGRICLISDSLRCCGMPDGEYELGGQQVFLSGGVARLADGTIAGAASDLYRDMLNAIAFGIPREEAITAATIRPAREIGRADEIGSIEAGKLADFVVCDASLSAQAVYIGGERV
jgi:N-acetylglucosamine-6-phosphate deacetylase